jgi:hypothetical protein
MMKVSKKQRKALRSVWRLAKPRKRTEHSRRISNAMAKGARR